MKLLNSKGATTVLKLGVQGAEGRAPKARAEAPSIEAPKAPRGVGRGEGVFFFILDHEIAFLAHSGRYILQFSCLLYVQNQAIYM